MLKIKLARYGKRKQPMYRIVINEARDKRDGKYVACIGYYAPVQEPKLLKIDMDAYKEWMKKGAQPTDTVAALAKRFASGNPFPLKKKKKLNKKAKARIKAEKEAKEGVKAEQPAEKKAEKPAAIVEKAAKTEQSAKTEQPAAPAEKIKEKAEKK